MLYVVCRDTESQTSTESVIELAEAVSAQVKGEMLICLDAEGHAVRMYSTSNVLAYSSNDTFKRAYLDADGN